MMFKSQVKKQIVVQLPLLESEKLLHFVSIDFSNEAEVGEVAFLLFSLLSQDVTLKGMFSFDFS